MVDEPICKQQTSLQKLQEFVAQLRHPEQGCPWILAQTLKSLATLTIEESYELAESIDQGNIQDIVDELSDVLLHIVLYAQLGKELKAFDLETIAQKAIDKQLRRKPVFHNNAVKTPAEALAQWEENKRKERNHKNKDKNPSVLDGIPHQLPGLNRAIKLQTQAASVGFDWPNTQPILSKLDEEIQELITEMKLAKSQENSEKVKEEMGDIFFTCVNLARHLGIDPELTLRHANNKFEHRFRKLENKVNNQGKNLHDCSLEEMDVIWDEIKKQP